MGAGASSRAAVWLWTVVAPSSICGRCIAEIRRRPIDEPLGAFFFWVHGRLYDFGRPFPRATRDALLHGPYHRRQHLAVSRARLAAAARDCWYAAPPYTPFVFSLFPICPSLRLSSSHAAAAAAGPGSEREEPLRLFSGVTCARAPPLYLLKPVKIPKIGRDSDRADADIKKEQPRGESDMAVGSLELPVVDLASPDLQSVAEAVRKACVESGFFYVTNHGIQDELLDAVFVESKKFFELPLDEKMLLERNSGDRGYTPPYAEKLDASSEFHGDLKESFVTGPVGDVDMLNDPNQWPPKERFPSWKDTMKLYHATALVAGKRILSLIALSLDLDVEFFQKIGAFDCPSAVIRLLHYSGEVNESDNRNYGASAHSDYGMITLLATDGTPGLQICREKDKHPQLWEDVPHIDGTLIVNIGDLLERWTNCIFRSTLHRVVTVRKERYSAAYFLYPNPDLVVECLESCCCEAYPPRFPPITGGNYLKERLSATYK